jgi:hypothetical protein
MANQRKEGKKLVGFWATEDEARALLHEAERRGMTVTGLLKSLIPNGSTPITQNRASKSTDRPAARAAARKRGKKKS